MLKDKLNLDSHTPAALFNLSEEKFNEMIEHLIEKVSSKIASSGGYTTADVILDGIEISNTDEELLAFIFISSNLVHFMDLRIPHITNKEKEIDSLLRSLFS